MYLTDTHWRGTTPEGRLDDLPAAQVAKLEEVMDLAVRHQVAAILHGGDLWDRPDVALAAARPFLQILTRAPAPIYAIAGNHDLFGFNNDTVPRTMLGTCEAAGLVRLIRPGTPAWIERDGLRIQVTGQPFHAEIDRRGHEADYCLVRQHRDGQGGHVRYPDTDFAIHLTHGMAIDKPFMEGGNIAYTLVDDILANTVADVTFGGHYHPGGCRSHRNSDRLFVNSGALSRLATTTSDYTRPVQVALVELLAGQTPRVELIPLSSARPATEVLDMAKRDTQRAREQAMQSFVAGIANLVDVDVADVQAILSQVAADDQVDSDVATEALRRLGIAQERVGNGGEAA